MPSACILFLLVPTFSEVSSCQSSLSLEILKSKVFTISRQTREENKLFRVLFFKMSQQNNLASCCKEKRKLQVGFLIFALGSPTLEGHVSLASDICCKFHDDPVCGKKQKVQLYMMLNSVNYSRVYYFITYRDQSRPCS